MIYVLSGGGLSKCSIIVHIETGSTVGAYSDAAMTTLVKAGKEIDTSGDYLITGLNPGTYYVKVTKGAKNRFGSVTFTETGVKFLDWTYNIALYNRGDENTLVTGGWIGVKDNIFGADHKSLPTLTKYEDYMYVKLDDQTEATNYLGGYITTNNAVDLSRFSKIHLVCHTSSAVAYKLGVLDSAKSNILSQQTLTRRSDVDTRLDISNINRIGYIAISIECSTGNRELPNIFLVELEV